MKLPFANTYTALPGSFYARVLPTPVSRPRLVALNRDLALQLGLDPDALNTAEGTEIVAGNQIAGGSEPLAMAYAGHQFGNLVPKLGDGRAILLGEVVDTDGARRDIQLKGSGPTPFSRRGDGRAALGPVLREYLVSEAMAALGIPTTRALAAVVTGDTVLRERPMPGAVLTRVAASHIRIGTFQFFAIRGDLEGLRILADYAIARHYPNLSGAGAPYLEFLKAVIARQAELVAKWLLVGFIHGVMNTDNMSISGETIDYGPCAFMDVYDPATVFSSIDEYGRYAYANQPGIAHWNLTRLAECLLPLLSDDQDEAVRLAEDALSTFSGRFAAAYVGGLRRKLGLLVERDDDPDLAEDLFHRMTVNNADYTMVFRGLCDAAAGTEADGAVRALFENPASYDEWAVRWRSRLADEPTLAEARQAAMRGANPAFIPRNHRVEGVIRAALEDDDFAPFQTLMAVLSRPYDDQPAFAAYADPPPKGQGAYQTFCGT